VVLANEADDVRHQPDLSEPVVAPLTGAQPEGPVVDYEVTSTLLPLSVAVAVVAHDRDGSDDGVPTEALVLRSEVLVPDLASVGSKLASGRPRWRRGRPFGEPREYGSTIASRMIVSADRAREGPVVAGVHDDEYTGESDPRHAGSSEIGSKLMR